MKNSILYFITAITICSCATVKPIIKTESLPNDPDDVAIWVNKTDKPSSIVFINDKNEYLGGAISPGLLMRFKALHTLTTNLPLIEKFDTTGLVGNDTKTSIISGCYNGMNHEIDYLPK